MCIYVINVDLVSRFQLQTFERSRAQLLPDPPSRVAPLHAQVRGDHERGASRGRERVHHVDGHAPELLRIEAEQVIQLKPKEIRDQFNLKLVRFNKNFRTRRHFKKNWTF